MHFIVGPLFIVSMEISFRDEYDIMLNVEKQLLVK